MNKFSEAFAAAKVALNSGDLAGDVKTLQAGLKSLVTSAGGPAVAEHAQLDKLRTALKDGAKPLVLKGTSDARALAKTIITGAGDGSKLADRAATLKMLRHLYHEKSAGGQVIWVYSPPVIYTKWIYDETAGASASTLEDILAKAEAEVYSESQRAVMASAVQTARSVTQAASVKLDGASDEVMALVRHYFGNASSTDKYLTDTMKTLSAGYMKISGACNNGSIVISDEPGDRTGGGWKDWAFIYTAETMSVIYLQGAWVAKADEATPSNQTPLYRCARTVIHELSHKELKTEDVVYGPKGLKPEGSTALTPEYAIHNADSWAYFAVDVAGFLTGPDKTNAETACKAILKTPANTLAVP